MNRAVPEASAASGFNLRFIIACVLLAIVFVVTPRSVMDQELDASNYGTYAEFVAEGRAFGPEVIPMTGPLGFVLYGHTYAGYLYHARWALELLLKAGFAALVLHLGAGLRPRSLGLGWLAAVVVMTPAVDDLLHDLALLLAGLIMLRAYQGGSRPWSWFAAALAGPFALLKGTHLVTSALVLGLAVGWGLIRGQRKLAAQQGGIFAASVLTAWLATGQSLSDLPLFLRNTLDLASGYNATMGLDEAPVVFATGFALAVGCGLLGALSLWVVRRDAGRVVPLLLVALFTFIKWKHGYLRADGHVQIFFAAVAVLAPTVWCIAWGSWWGVPPGWTRDQRLVGLALLTAVTTWAVLGAAGFSRDRVFRLVTNTLSAIPRHAPYVFAPGRIKAELETRLQANRREWDLPQVRDEVGSEPIDFFGFEQGVLLLNGLNYQPRPMGGGTFNVFTPRLQAINAAYVRDPSSAPPWYLLKIGYLDDRLASAEDGLTLRTLLELYSPQLMQRDYLLLHRRVAPPPPQEPVVLSRRVFRPGEIVPVPETTADQMVLFSLHSSLDWNGRLQSLLYRPPDATLHVRLGTRDLWRGFALKPPTVRQPVILSPLVNTTGDIIDLFGEAGFSGTPITAVRLEVEPGFATQEFEITFYASPRPPPPENTDIAEIRTYADHPLFNREPLEEIYEDTGIRELNKEPVRVVHAPGSMTWELQPGDQQLLFSYGIIPQAYLGETTTDGVEFNVEILWPDGDGRILWQRMMRPQRVANDRGMQRLRLPLPPYEPGMRLRIRTHPGQDNDGAYDQSYVTRLQIKSGPLIGAQFSGLGAVPTNALLPRDAMAGVDDHPVYLIHAPNEVRIPIPPGATRLTFDHGLLPGAYQSGGNSDGVEFGVFVAPPAGDLLFVEGWLDNPRDNPEDRGILSRTVPLPETEPGSVLVLATNVGPQGDRGWDQSFIAHVRFD